MKSDDLSIENIRDFRIEKWKNRVLYVNSKKCSTRDSTVLKAIQKRSDFTKFLQSLPF